MKLNEAVAIARRIGPIRCVDSDGIPVTSGFGTAGAVEISVNDGAFIAALGSITVIGGGYVYYNATPADASVRGFVSVKLEGICQESTFREEVERSPQGIPAGTADAALCRVGPLRIVDADGVELASLAGITCEISINGSAWAAPSGLLVLTEAGYADYVAALSETASVGWLAVKLTGACQEFAMRATVVDATTGGGSLSAPTLTVLTTFSASFAAARLTPWQATLDDFPVGAQAIILVHFVERNEMYVARDAEGVWRWPFDLEPDNAVDLNVDPVTVQLIPRGGWHPCDIEVQIAAAVMAEEA
ncbi:MAG TPA: hypothetical protein VMZ53_03895 [Kofleriaceae bacterium]|nr:hypothetical protein [Kofleriaceae bacterium]